MAADEIVNFLLGNGMTILKLVQSGKLLYVQPIGSHNICHINVTVTQSSAKQSF